MTSETKGLKRDAAELRATIRAYMRCLDEETARAEAAEARCARLAKALRNVPIFHSNGYTKTCQACGASHWFDKGPPVVIRHKEGCWGAAILEFLATLSDTEQETGDG